MARKIVRDEEIGEMPLALQPLHQIENLRLDRHVERRDRFVGDDEVGIGGERAGDADALLLAAGELVRIAVDESLARARPSASAREPASRFSSRAAASRNVSIGSAMICPTVMRGSSDAYGS